MKHTKKLSQSFYAAPALDVARALIGKHLVHAHAGRRMSGRIVETEAYIGREDQACHARFGPTPRAKLLFGPPGFAYVFLVYGMHDCFNVVVEAEGSPAAILVRALEPMNDTRGATNGPGKLCRALAITRAQNGLDVTDRPLWIEDRDEPPATIATTPRIGVDYAGEWANKPWRFVDTQSKWLSRKLPRS